MSRAIKPELPNDLVLITCRTMLSRLWFSPQSKVGTFFQAALARYQEAYKVELYAFVLMENHYHLVCRFPECNRAAFERDLNSVLARALKDMVKEFPGGKLWGSPYSLQVLPRPEDIEKYFLYTILNPVSTGITKDPLACDRPNALRILRRGGSETFRWFERHKYENARRKNNKVDKERYYTYHTLTISKLPNLQHLSNQAYLAAVEAMVAAEQERLITERKESGKGFLGERKLLQQTPGAFPRTTKKNSREAQEPRVLCSCPETRQFVLDKFEALYEAYHKASLAFRQGNLTVIFPENCYMPSKFVPIVAH